MLGEPSGACFGGGKSGVESLAYVSMWAFGNSHSGSGRWLRSMWSGKSPPVWPFVVIGWPPATARGHVVGRQRRPGRPYVRSCGRHITLSG